MSATSFLDALHKSGLVPEDELDRFLAALKAKPGFPFDDSTLARVLIAEGMLTAWQAEMLLEGKYKGFHFGHYRLLDRLSSTDTALIYLAEDDALQRRVAIKIHPPSDRGLRPFFREAQGQAAMEHRNIVRLHQVSQVTFGGEAMHYLGMEYVEGANLRAIVERERPLPHRRAAEYIRQAAEGLAHIHGKGLIHRNIEPSNLLLGTDDVVKICDFRLVRAFPFDVKFDSGGDPLENQQIDLYGLGCTFYFLLTGQVFSRSDAAAPIGHSNPDVPIGVWRIIERMTDPRRESRFQSAEEVATAVSEWT
jgi:serine/threonine protein kinase